MDSTEETNNPQQTAELGSVPPAGCEESRDETRRKGAAKQLFGSGTKVLFPGEKRPESEDLQANLIIQNQAAKHYTAGKEAMGKFQYERAALCIYKAATLQPEQSQLYASQAEAFLQLCDFQSAVSCYKQASFLEPGAFSARLAFVYFLQGQCLCDRGLFSEALQAFSQAAEMKPGSRIYELRSLVCLAAAGRHADCLKLLTDRITQSPTADLLVFRARLHKQLNQMSGCLGDLKSALALSPANQEARVLLLQLREASKEARHQAVNRTLCGQLQEALCLVNIALELRPQHRRLYLFRGILFRRLKDFTAAVKDLVQTMELSEEEEEEEEEEGKDESDSIKEEAQFQLVLTYNDFAVQCFNRALYAEATLLLNKALEEEKGLAGLYLNRGDCFFKQGDWLYALADYQQAEEMMWPNDPAVRLRLAVVHNALASSCFQDGCFQVAADMFSLAIRYNPITAHYYENRSKTHRKLLDLRGAREDLIRLMILDPTNEEVPPMLMSMFPGCSVSEVVSSPKGRAVRVQLMDAIQNLSSSSDPQR